MLPFTNLEKSILDAICDANRSTLLRISELLSTAGVSSRDNTGHGFYTEIQLTSDACNDVQWPDMISGPYAWMLEMGEEALMGFILWCSARGPATLEGFQCGDAKGETVDLKDRDLSDLRFSHLGWG